ncbi:MAG: hybrid sensor histidine kinase/response regulator [bacterium]|nr:hybrid sensor histidine kinase/response regulator [bacterium]
MQRVLVIEDQPTILENILETLELEGFVPLGADSGYEGLQTAFQHHPDLILCDLMMPEIDGYQVLRELRRNPQTASIPVIILTAAVDHAAYRQGMELGADDYLTKPFSPLELVGAIQTRLQKRQALESQMERKIQGLRDNLIYALPHELRTPLTSILGCADFLITEHEELEPDRILELGGIVQNEASRLQRIIENYLLYTQITTTAADAKQVQTLHAEELYYPGSLIEEIGLALATRSGRLDDVEIYAQDTPLNIAEQHLHKIIHEMIDNALKFSMPGSRVSIQGRRSSRNEYVITISDQGRGMTPEQIRSVEAYTQFDRALHEQQGLGFGLIIAWRLVELYTGTFNIESVPGRGTTVQITFTAR